MKKEITGIVPFNEFWFRNCYYRQLVTGLTALDVDINSVILNGVMFALPEFELDKGGIISEKKLERICGYRVCSCDLGQNDIIACINQETPVIIGIDCYDFKDRKDTYHKKHSPHFILIYGYDLETGEFDIIDHNYTNGFDYIKKTTSADNIAEANYGYKKLFSHGFGSCHVIRKTKKEKEGIHLLKELKTERLKESWKNSRGNMERLKQLIISFDEVPESVTKKIYRYLDGMRSSFSCLMKAEGNLFKTVLEMVPGLVNYYNELEWLIWRQMMQKNKNFSKKNAEEVSEKIEYINLIEQEVCTDLETALVEYKNIQIKEKQA